MNLVIPLERVENSINQALQKSQDLNAQSRSKEEVSLLIARLQTKEQYDVLLRQILKSDFCVPVLERKFALYCIQKMCERLKNNIRPYVPKIIRYLCQRVKDNESLDDTAYNRQLVQTISFLMKSLYKQNETTDIYGEVIQVQSSTYGVGNVNNETINSTMGASTSQNQYSPFAPLNLIITRLMEYIQTEDHKTNAVVSQLLCEVFYQARQNDLIKSAPELAETFFRDARKFNDRFVFKNYQVQLLSILTVLIQKYGVHILRDEEQISKYIKLIQYNLSSREYQIRLNACILLKVILMQKILLPEQISQFRAKIENMKRSDLSNLVRKEAQEIWFLISQFSGESHEENKTKRESFADFKRKLQAKNLEQKLRDESRAELREELQAPPEEPPETTQDIPEQFLAPEIPPEPEPLPEAPPEPFKEESEREFEKEEEFLEPEQNFDNILDQEQNQANSPKYSPENQNQSQEQSSTPQSAQQPEIPPETLQKPQIVPPFPPKRQPIEIQQDDIPFLDDVAISGVTQKMQKNVPNYTNKRPSSANFGGSNSVFGGNRPGSASLVNSQSVYEPQMSQSQGSRVIQLSNSQTPNSLFNRQNVDFNKQFQQLQDQKLNFNIYKQKALQLLAKAQPCDVASIQDEQLKSGALDIMSLLLSDGYVNQISPWVYVNNQHFNNLQRRMMLQKLQRSFSGGQQWEDIARLQEVLQ